MGLETWQTRIGYRNIRLIKRKFHQQISFKVVYFQQKHDAFNKRNNNCKHCCLVVSVEFFTYWKTWIRKWSFSILTFWSDVLVFPEKVAIKRACTFSRPMIFSFSLWHNSQILNKHWIFRINLRILNESHLENVESV